MPVYEYRCSACGRTFEHFTKRSTARIPACVHCGSDDVSKCVSAPAAVRIGQPRAAGQTCCGRQERCDSPPCQGEAGCRRSGE